MTNLLIKKIGKKNKNKIKEKVKKERANYREPKT
jgi:hypothetical protein